MFSPTKAKRSLFITLGVILVTTIVLIMSIEAAYIYFTTKRQIIEEMQTNSRQTAISLEKNIGGMIMAYAVNEYDKLVYTEMERRDNFAIIIDDYNMGKVFGVDAFVSGKIRDSEGDIVDFVPENEAQVRQLEGSFFSEKHLITDDVGNTIGAIRIFNTDEEMRQRLEEIVVGTSLNALFISLLLIFSLFIAIRRYILSPLSDMVETINATDEEGIPLNLITRHGPRELMILSTAMNGMISAVRESRVKLQESYDSLAKEKERFQLAVEGTNDGMWDWNLKTDEVLHSSRFETMLGYEVGELPDTIDCWAGLLHPDDKEKAFQVVEDYLSHKDGTYESTFRMRAKSGEWRWITGRGKAVFDDSGVPLRFVGFNTDITEQKRMQMMVMQTEKMMSVGGLAAGVAHELNNPLGGILQGLQNIKRRLSPDFNKNTDVAEELGVDLDKFKTYMERRDIDQFLDGIEDSGQRAKNIISNMLMFSRKADTDKKAESINSIIKNTLDLVAVDYDLKKHYDFQNIELVINLEQGLPDVICVASEIQQVFFNIFRNAAHALYHNKLASNSPVLAVRSYKQENMACIEIEDNGPGMDEETKRRVFEPFYTTKDVGEGTGLGLSISYYIVVEEHGGSIGVESHLGQGTTFTLCLPV